MATRKYLLIDDSNFSKTIQIVSLTTQTDSLKDYELSAYADFLERPEEEVKNELGYYLYRHFTTQVDTEHEFSSDARETLIACRSKMAVEDYITDVMFQVVSVGDFERFVAELDNKLAHYAEWKEYKRQHEEQIELARENYEREKEEEKARKAAEQSA